MNEDIFISNRCELDSIGIYYNEIEKYYYINATYKDIDKNGNFYTIDITNVPICLRNYPLISQALAQFNVGSTVDFGFGKLSMVPKSKIKISEVQDNTPIMSLGFHDDGKGKYQSFEVGLDYKKIEEELSKRYNEFRLSTLDLEVLRGYGETKEEALKEFTKCYDAMVNQLVEFQKILHKKGTGIDMRELDCFFNPVDT